jgi:hypothetical protein
LGTWALEGQGMFYGAKPMQKPGEDTSYPAIIDTGSSQLSIPPDVFEKIRQEWASSLPNLDCTSDKTFCHVKDSCENVAPKLQPVGFQMSDYVFEINPEQYLYKSSHKKCYFVVHKCRLPGKNKNLFLIGDAFLKHFYSVYDFDRDTLSLESTCTQREKSQCISQVADQLMMERFQQLNKKKKPRINLLKMKISYSPKLSER